VVQSRVFPEALGEKMNASFRKGELVSLYTLVPQQLLEWANSAGANQSILSAANDAARTIECLNREREVRREELHQPITL
jgi:hypothetical protein